MNISKLFNKPKIIAVIGDVNTGKSMLLYHLLHSLSTTSKFNLFTYGLRTPIKNAIEIFSVAEMEQIRDSFIIIDELSSLFDLDNRKVKSQIENTLRLLNHNNNIIVVCGTPENFKKFLSAKIDIAFYNKSTLSDFINGSRVKNILMSYRGNERGTEVLNLPVEEVLCFDGQHYHKMIVPYYKKYDSKKTNAKIFVRKSVRKNVQNKKCDKNDEVK